jgi:hypothetical protein
LRSRTLDGFPRFGIRFAGERAGEFATLLAYTERPMRVPLATLLVAAACALLSLPATAAAMAPPAAPAARVVPGAMVVTAVPVLPPGAREFELLLLPDSGPAIRVSPETPAGAREIRWRVPRLIAHRLRLVLRAGGENMEWESAPSAPFALAPPAAGELGRLIAGRSEAGYRIERPGAPPSGLSSAADRDEIVAASTPPRAIQAPSAPGVAQRTAALFDCLRGRLAHAAPRASRTTLRSPAFTPLRI